MLNSLDTLGQTNSGRDYKEISDLPSQPILNSLEDEILPSNHTNDQVDQIGIREDPFIASQLDSIDPNYQITQGQFLTTPGFE